MLETATGSALHVGKPSLLERVFALKANGTTVRTEVFAGFTTFLTMAYIVVVNPSILGEAGLPVAAVAAATCLAAGFGSILMGLLSNYPLALAPGMGMNAYFTYTVVKGLGVPWQTALGCVFISGAVFLLLTLSGVRQVSPGVGYYTSPVIPWQYTWNAAVFYEWNRYTLTFSIYNITDRNNWQPAPMFYGNDFLVRSDPRTFEVRLMAKF